MEILKYKGFEGSTDLDMKRNVCRGKILYIDDVVTYESKSIDDLQKQFEDAVDDYVETCNQIGKEPQKPCRGQFNVRLSPELHRAATRRAIADDTSLNDVVCQSLEAYLAPATSSASVTLPSVEIVGANTNSKLVLYLSNYGARNLAQPGSAANTVRVSQSADHAESKQPKQYWEATGSQIVELQGSQDISYTH